LKRALAVVGLFCVLAACKPSASIGNLDISPDLASLVPSDTVFVIGANLRQIRDTAIYQKLLSRAPLPQLDEFARRTGLDPRKDLDQILSCSNGKENLLMARGSFRMAEIEARLRANHVEEAAYKSHTLFGGDRTSILLLNSSTALFGPAADLRAIIDRGSQGPGLPAPLRDLLKTLPSGDQVYGALTGGLEGLNFAPPQNSNLASVIQALKTVDRATLGMDLRKGFQLNISVFCQTDRDAKFVHDVVRGIVGFGRLNTPDDHPELLKLYDSIQVTQDQARADVKADIPQDLADQFLDLWLKR